MGLSPDLEQSMSLGPLNWRQNPTWYGAAPTPGARQQPGAMPQRPAVSAMMQSTNGANPLNKRRFGQMFQSAQQAQLQQQHPNIPGRARGGPVSGTPDMGFGDGKGVGLVGGDGTHGRPRAVVTGGYGASPAAPGRIGYRGRLQARPSGGLSEYYNNQNDLAMERAAKSNIDPNTGLPYNASQAQRTQQLQRIAGKPDVGLRQAGLLRQYFDALSTGNPSAVNSAASNIFREREYMGRENTPATTSSLPPPPTVDRTTSDSEFPIVDWSKINRSYEPVVPKGLKEGGAADGVKPYIVNEEGEEAFQPKGGQPQLMKGSEKMVAFPRDGKVIPHSRTRQLIAEGKVKMPEHVPAKEQVKVLAEKDGDNAGLKEKAEHRANGGVGKKSIIPESVESKSKREANERWQKSKETLNKLMWSHFTPEDVARMRAEKRLPTGETSSYGQLGPPVEVFQSPYSLAEKHIPGFSHTINQLGIPAEEVFNAWAQDQHFANAPTYQDPKLGPKEAALLNSITNYNMPNVMPSLLTKTPSLVTPQAMTTDAVAVPKPNEQVVPPPNPEQKLLERMSNVPEVTPLPKIAGTQEFATPYGTIGVNQTGNGPHLIDGKPAAQVLAGLKAEQAKAAPKSNLEWAKDYKKKEAKDMAKFEPVGKLRKYA